MRHRNYLLALVMLALFAACGVWYFRAYVEPKKPFGIILFVGEGLVTSKLAAARLYDGGADRRLNIESLPHVALLNTSAADFAVPDSAAAASALACGTKVNHHALGIDPAGRRLVNLLEAAASAHRATGLLTNGLLTGPSPAAFYAHTADCRRSLPLAEQLFGPDAPEVIFGNGGRDLLPVSKGGLRDDNRDLTQEAISKGYTFLSTADSLRATLGTGPRRLLGIFDGEHLDLAEMVAAAIDNLQRHRGGYVLIVDAGLIEDASLQNRSERTLQQLLELDRAVAVATRYAGPQSLVLVAGGQSTGGMALNGYPLRQDRGVSLLGGINAYGFPSITWATGPAGPVPNASPPTNPAAYYSPYAANIADDAVAAGVGPGSEGLQGFRENTFIYELIHSQL